MNKNKKPKMTKNDLKTAKRLMKYVTEKYKFQLNKIAARWPAKAVAQFYFY